MEWISILLLIPGVAAYSTSQLQGHGKLKWSKPGTGFWEYSSDKRKYKLPLEPAPNNWYTSFFVLRYRERFPLSSTFLVSLTDGYHLCQSILFISVSASLSVATSINFFLTWGGVLFVHFITYRLLQR